jgi:hypothetical protein
MPVLQLLEYVIIIAFEHLIYLWVNESAAAYICSDYCRRLLGEST